MRFIFFLDKILPLVFWVLLMFGFDSAYIAVLTIIAALIHEGGHLIAMLPFSKSKGNCPRADISGFRINASGLSYKEELAAALGGPLVNLLIGALCLSLPASSYFAEYIKTFGILNIITMISNLLPIAEYDGYKIVKCIIALCSNDASSGERILYWISFLFSAVMCFLSLYIMLKLGEGYWIFAVFFSVLLSYIVKRQRYAIYENNRDFERF